MPRRKYKTVYTFDELSDKAKDKARDWWRQGGLDYEWWGYIYEDAKRVGLEITSFGLDRDKHATGHLTMTLQDSIKAILKDHGKDCATYKLATKYQEDVQEATVKARLNEDEDAGEAFIDALEELTEAYEKDLLAAYANMLQDECDYLLSDEAVDETIRANEYEFTKGGERE